MPIVKGLEWTFNTRAELYDRMRPGYPKELFRMRLVTTNRMIMERS